MPGARSWAIVAAALLASCDGADSTCQQALAASCGQYHNKDNTECLSCMGSHQHELREAGCSPAAVSSYCETPAGNRAIPGDFDLYVLTQSWQPEFCHGKTMPGCHPNASAYMHNHLTLHGLWPQYDIARQGQTYPFNCTDEKFDPAVLDQLPGGRQDILKYWPNGKADPTNWAAYSQFCQHEWAKHGTCTGLTQLQYFSAAIAKLQQEGTVSQAFPSIQTPQLCKVPTVSR
jgi:ribonuclease I